MEVAKLGTALKDEVLKIMPVKKQTSAGEPEAADPGDFHLYVYSDWNKAWIW